MRAVASLLAGRQARAATAGSRTGPAAKHRRTGAPRTLPHHPTHPPTCCRLSKSMEDAAETEATLTTRRRTAPSSSEVSRKGAATLTAHVSSKPSCPSGVWCGGVEGGVGGGVGNGCSLQTWVGWRCTRSVRLRQGHVSRKGACRDGGRAGTPYVPAPPPRTPPAAALPPHLRLFKGLLVHPCVVDQHVNPLGEVQPHLRQHRRKQTGGNQQRR